MRWRRDRACCLCLSVSCCRCYTRNCKFLKLSLLQLAGSETVCQRDCTGDTLSRAGNGGIVAFPINTQFTTAYHRQIHILAPIVRDQ